MNRDVCEHFNPVDLPCEKCKSASVQKSTLREAAQQALEAMETVELDIEWRAASPTHKMLSKAITALRAALAEPVQEPVAWRWGYRSITTGEMDWRGYVEIAADPNLRSPAIIMQPLYTAPPQRKPLTEEEIETAYKHIWRNVPDDFEHTTYARIEQAIRYAEQAHGIKE